jgi:hypothetical protein
LKKDVHFPWGEQSKQLPALSQKFSSSEEFINAALQNIVEILGLKRATHLTCILEEGRIDYDVTAETFPVDRNFDIFRSSELKKLIVNTISERANERYIEQTLTFESRGLNVKVFQIRLPETNAQHFLVLTADACTCGSAGTGEQGSESLQLSEEDKKAGLKYLAQLAKIASSMITKSQYHP